MKLTPALSVTAASLAICAGSARAQSFGEGFESPSIPVTWLVHNQSSPLGTTTWASVTNDGGYGPHSGARYASANYQAGSNLATVSVWLITPQVALRNGDTFTFWTRSTSGTFPDRMQLRMSTAGTSTNTGSGATDVGDFSTLLLDINPTYSHEDYPTGYPLSWRAFNATVSGLSGPVGGRFALRYFVENSGPSGPNGDFVGIDDVAYTSVTDPTGSCCLGDGSCVQLVSGVCTGQGGAYHGDGSTCASITCPSGACCLPNLTCATSTASPCTAQGGIYRGDGSACATANCPGPTAGPDVVVSEVFDVSRDAALGNITAYSVGTDACNIGDVGVSWISGTNQHPVISGNMFRLKTVNGADRFEQLGMSWYKHGFLATNGSFCGTCTSSDGTHLGPHGCSDVYSSGLNGSQAGMGPRSELNATTGVFTYPSGHQTDNSVIARRCQVFTADIDPAQNPGALYYADAHYIVPDDAQFSASGANATNGLNNVSYRQILIASTTATPTFAATTHSYQPGIQAWKDHDASVTQAFAEYIDSTTPSNIVSRFIVAAKATDLGGGQWHYEYAIYNVNADRAGGSFSVPIPAGAVVSNIGFHAPFYHSGEVYDNTAWNAVVSAGAVTWTPAAFSPPENANALRWGTLYNFRFDANVPPGVAAATLGLFKVGVPASLSIPGLPAPGVACYANCDNSTTAPALNVLDFSCFLNRFAAGDTYANCDHSTTAPVLNVLDFSCFINSFAAGCS